MKSLKFPTAQTILFVIAGMVAILTWIVPSGKYDSLTYNSDTKMLVRSSEGETTELPATQQTLEDLNVKIPIENFTNGDIYKPIGIPNTYKALESYPQGVVAFLRSPIKGIYEAADIIFLVLIIGGFDNADYVPFGGYGWNRSRSYCECVSIWHGVVLLY